MPDRFETGGFEAVGFEAVGLEAAWQVSDLSSQATVGEHVDEPLPMVSLVKVVWLLVLLRLVDRGDLDPSAPVTLTPDGRARGTTGVSAMSDPVTMSLRDAAYLALTISDNAAGDALYDAVGVGRIADELATLELSDITALEPMRDLYDRLEDDCVADPFAAPTTNTATPRALGRLLTLVWSNAAASERSCEQIRNLMARQVWGHRLAPAFPARDITVAAKSATAGGLRHEMGVITYPGAHSYVAVMMTNQVTAEPDHRADETIGRAARSAIVQLRRGLV